MTTRRRRVRRASSRSSRTETFSFSSFSPRLVALHPGKGLGEVVIEPVDRVLLHGGLAAEGSVFRQQRPEGLAQLRVVAEQLRHDVGGPRQGVLRRLYALFGVDIPGGFLRRVRAVRPLGEEPLRQGGQTLLPGHGGPGAALLLIGAVQVLHLRQGGGGVDGLGELFGEPALLVDGFFHRLPPLLEAPEVLEPLLQIAEGGVVHGSVVLLAVAGDEGDGVALVQKVHHILYMLRALVQLPGEHLNNRFHRVPFLKLLFSGTAAGTAEGWDSIY